MPEESKTALFFRELHCFNVKVSIRQMRSYTSIMLFLEKNI